MKRISFVFILSLFVTFAFSQLYVDLNAGYGLPMSADNITLYTSNSAVDFEVSDVDLGTGDTYQKSVPVSLGNGLNANLTIGYLMDNLGFELEAGYNVSSSYSAYKKYVISSVTSVSQYTVLASYLHFDPGVRFAPQTRSGFSPYVVVGAVVGLPNIKFSSVDTNLAGDVIVNKWKYSGNVALGLKTKVGTEFSLSNNLVFFAELRMVNMSYSPAKGELYESTRNGANRLDDLTTSEKEVVFEKELNNPPSSSADPTYYLKDSYPFGSLGLNLGIRLEL